jgi:2-polyprenyl-3-methyl-5-hydroxy-6-metoxy-1,4-benzoquinol methylase
MTFQIREGRLFYEKYAWAYDLIISRNQRQECAFIENVLADSGIGCGAVILDAGCGTGNYSVELMQRGFHVTGVDRSSQLLMLARKNAEAAGLEILFDNGDILTLNIGRRYDAVLCRGVLNDLVEERDRIQVFRSFAASLRFGGLLVLDVRDWVETVKRKSAEPVSRKKVVVDGNILEFTATSKLDQVKRLLRVHETHKYRDDESRYDFTMKCWTKEELARNMSAAGFGEIAFFDSYTPQSAPEKTDRIVAKGALVSS